jgi:hypothetical protein
MLPRLKSLEQDGQWTQKHGVALSFITLKTIKLQLVMLLVWITPIPICRPTKSFKYSTCGYQEFMLLQTFKHHPLIKNMLEGGKPIAYGARYPNFLIKTYCSNKEP